MLRSEECWQDAVEADDFYPLDVRTPQRDERAASHFLISKQKGHSFLSFPYEPRFLALGERLLPQRSHTRQRLVGDQHAVVDRQQQNLHAGE